LKLLKGNIPDTKVTQSVPIATRFIGFVRVNGIKNGYGI